MTSVHDTNQDCARFARVTQLLDTIAYAHFRCLSADELLDRISCCIDDPDGTQYVGRLAELDLDSACLDRLTTVMRELATRSEDCRSAVKARVDRTILRLVRLLPPSKAKEFVEPFLTHRRKTRRTWAYRGLRDTEISSSMAMTLIKTFRDTGDQDALTLIARHADAVLSVDADELLENLEEEYWRARVIEVLLMHHHNSALSLSHRYPLEFVHAVGRTQDASLLQPVRELFDANRDDIDFLSMYAYALGKLGASKQLIELERFVRSEYDEQLDPGTDL